jgi:hypothetical protein
MSIPQGRNTIWLDMRCEEGRCQVGLGLDHLSDTERMWLFRLLEGSREGRRLGFGVDSTPEGDQVLKFRIASIETPLGPSRCDTVN